MIEHRFPTLAETSAALAKHAAQRLAAADTPRVIAVPGGRTPAAFLAELAAQPLDWPGIVVALTDERRAAPESGLCNRGSVEAAFASLGAGGPAIIAPGDADFGLRAPKLDVVVLGMGTDGHIASLFPGQPMDAPGGGAVIAVTPDPLPPEAPVARWSLSLGALVSAGAVFLLIAGPAKRATLEARQGPIGRLCAAREIEVYWAERTD